MGWVNAGNDLYTNLQEQRFLKVTDMDEAKLSAIQAELKSVKALFASLERDQIALEERIAVADRSQRRIGYYLCGLFILFTASIIFAGILIL